MQKLMPIPKEYYEWIQERLPIGILSKKNLSYLYIDHTYAIYSDQDKTNEKALVFQANSEEEAKYFLLKEVYEDVGRELELQRRKLEQKKWRYVWDEEKTTPGHVVLKEQSNYQYNVEYDSRKWWMEYVLKCLKSVCDDTFYRNIADYYLSDMNYWFDKPHWAFDDDKVEFVEI